MPELAEVEIICRQLKNKLIGKNFKKVYQFRKDLRIVFPENFAKKLEGQFIIDIKRRAKFILIELSNRQFLVIHLGMSGHLAFSNITTENKHKHDHVIFQFNDGSELRYNDPRRFGLMSIIPIDGITSHPLMSNMGPEPFGSEFTPEYLHKALGRRTGSIKAALMDNQLVVGVGNIYACESLHEAKISPLVKCNRISLHDAETLVSSIRIVLERAINAGGSSLRDYKHINGDGGNFQSSFKVYGKKDCGTCGSLISKVRQAGRTSFFCEICQKS